MYKSDVTYKGLNSPSVTVNGVSGLQCVFCDIDHSVYTHADLKLFAIDSSESNGTATFPNLFDDFESGGVSGWTITGNTDGNSFTASTDRAKGGTYSGKIYEVSNSVWVEATKAESLSNNLSFDFDLYDDLDASAFKCVRLINNTSNEIGFAVHRGSQANHYTYHNKAYSYTNTNMDRSAAWSRFSIILGSDSSAKFLINDALVGTLTSQFNDATKVALASYFGASYTTTFYVDNIRVRKYVSPEPTWSTWGLEEPCTVQITNSPDTKDFGILEVNTATNTSMDYFTITNTDNCAVDVTIQGTDAAGGDDTWTLSDNTTPGVNRYGLQAGLDDVDGNFDVTVNTTANVFVTGLADGDTQDWGLKIYIPTAVTGYDGQEMIGTITLIASEA